MRLFITGGAGFIGSNFIRHTLAAHPGYRIVNFDKLTYAGNLSNLQDVETHPDYSFARGDICDREAVVEAIRGADAVINFAAESHVDRSIEHAADFIMTNVVGTQVLLDAARAARVSRFVQISCYDERTRALTKSGLKRYSEIQVGDTVLSLNSETGKLEEKRVEKVIVQDYEGEMIHFKNVLVDLKVTPNHRMLFRQKGRSGLGPIRVEEAQNLLDKHLLFYPKGIWKGTSDDSVDIETIGRVPIKELFYVAGVFIGDGFIATQRKLIPSLTGLDKRESDEARRNPITGRFEKCPVKVGTKHHVTCTSWRIFFDVPERDKARKRLQDSLTTLRIKWKAHKGKSGEHIYFNSREWTDFFGQFGRGFQNKHIPDWMLDCDTDALAALFDGLIDSDGHFNKSGGPIFSSSSRRLVENICELGIKLGLSPRITKRDISTPGTFAKENRLIRASTDAYIVYFRTGNIGVGQRSYVKDSYKGKIWCVKVEDNRNLVIERNGLLQFCGNTDEVMGSCEEGGYFTESSPLRPNSPYAASKAAAEHFVRAARITFGLDVVTTRASNNYGPYQFPEKLIPLMIANALEDRELPVYGDGLNVRDWLYVEDCCRAIDAVLHRGRSGEVYNVGSRAEKTNLEVVRALLDLLGKPHSLIRFVTDRPGHDRRYATAPDKIETELGWSARETFESALEKTVLWYKNNTAWIASARSGEYAGYYERMYAAREILKAEG